MTDLRTAAQAVIDDSHGYGYVTPETLNMLEQALAEPEPSVDALIGEIDGIERHGYSEYGMIPDRDGDWIDHSELKPILDKYRGVK